MSVNRKILVPTQTILGAEMGVIRKPYRKPQLEILGDLRTLTLGASAPSGESGNVTTHHNPLGLPQPEGFPLPEGFPYPEVPPQPLY
jgi:hypothetical protein